MENLDTKGLFWDDSLSLGVENIDNDHKQLFAILHHVLKLLATGEQDRREFACREALDFLEKYTRRHFAREEAFQRELGYAGYEMHKALHDNLCRVTLPDMNRELEEKNFSQDAVERFVGIFTGWLMWHVMIEDQAIVGKRTSMWTGRENVDDIEALDKEMYAVMQSLLREEITLINRHYTGERLNSAISYVMCFRTELGDYDVVYVADRTTIEMFARKVLGRDVDGVDAAAFMAYVEIAQMTADRMLRHLYGAKEVQLTAHHGATGADIAERFKDGFPALSLLWRLKNGLLGMCIEKK